jgi:hypothetical protein
MRILLIGLMTLGILSAKPLIARAAEEEKVVYTVKVLEAKAIQATMPGGATVRVKAELEIKNGGTAPIGVSSRSFEYKLVMKGKKEEDDQEHQFFGHVEPELSDIRPLKPGTSIKLAAILEGHTIEIEKAKKYTLLVKGYGKEIVTPVAFK